MKDTLVSLLRKFSGVFILGLTRTIVITGELKIGLQDPNLAVHGCPNRVNHEEKQEVRNKINQFLQAYIIQPSISPFASIILPVTRRFESHRSRSPRTES